MMNPAVADDWPVFRVDNPDLISLLKLPERDTAKNSDGKHYSWNQIQPMFDTFAKENERVQKIEAANRTAYENAITKMQERLQLYATLRNTVQPPGAQDWPDEVDAFVKLIPDGVAAVQAQQAGQTYNQTNFSVFVAIIQEFQFMAGLQPPVFCPPMATANGGGWGKRCWSSPHQNPALDDSIHDYAQMTGGWPHTSPANSTPRWRFDSLFAHNQPKAVAKARAEVFFNQMQPFYYAMVIYIFAGLLVLLLLV